MFEYKLQIGCLLVILYFIVSYLRESQSRKVPRNKYFGIILFFAPCAVIFDGITSWTVNHLEQVPLALNQFLHGCFFVSANVVIIYYFLYLVSSSKLSFYSQCTIDIINIRILQSNNLATA